MTFELARPDDKFGYRDYDQICAPHINEIFKDMSEACADREDHANLPYNSDFAQDHMSLAKFNTQFAELMLGEQKPQSTVVKIGECILTARAIMEQLESYGASVAIDRPVLCDFNPHKPGKLIELIDTTDLYRSVRPHLNRLVDYFVEDIFSSDPAQARYCESGKVITNLVLHNSEAVAYRRFKQKSNKPAID